MSQIALTRPAASRRSLSPVLGAATVLVMLAALYAALIWTPTDAFQGMTQRIFYFHIALAWLAYFSFFVVFVGSVLYLTRRSKRWDRLAIASAELGVIFTTLVLITGSLWGRQIWGTWWVWDARLTSTLVLWLIYVGYLMLRSTLGEGDRTSRYAAVLGIVGFIDVPIIHMSVTWWRTLHPAPVVVRPGDGPQLPPSMFIASMIAVLAFTLLYAWLLHYRYQLESDRERLAGLRRQIAAGQ